MSSRPNNLANNNTRKRTALRRWCVQSGYLTPWFARIRVTNRLPHPHRDNLDGKLHFVAEPVIVICGLRNETQDQEEPETKASEQTHAARRQEVLLRGVHDPLTPVDRQVDFPVASHFFEQPLDVGLLHKTEAHLDGDNTASFRLAVKDSHPITVIPDVGDLSMRYLN